MNALGRPVTYIGKESNKLEETQAGLVHDPRERLNAYMDPREEVWRDAICVLRRECADRFVG
jgi:hypothetical protein